ncbi:MAG: hypothetical protein Q8913_05330 [Bacteroidota bacterium]|nr:hypothetical protein [Bacteroidota bacterium]
MLGLGLYRAFDLRWISDDAFITLRYVKNFVEGKGLVYNVGERVEGYTHFLWLLLLAAVQWLGFDPADASIMLGILCYAGVLGLLLRISFVEHAKNPRVIWLPVAAGLFAMNYDSAIWASVGLETSFFTMLIMTAFYLWFYSKYPEQKRLLLTGLVLASLCLTRPDGVLFPVTAIALLSVRGLMRRQPVTAIFRQVGLLLVPSIVIGIPYLLWKYSYYGDILPLTYYAKSADHNYFGQGFFYIWLYFRVYFTSAIALIAATWLILRGRSNDGEEGQSKADRGSSSITALITILVYLIVFVAKTGGDFMFARFMIPVVPFIGFVIERGLARLPAKVLRYRTGIAVLLLASVIMENKLRDPIFIHHNEIGEERGNWDRVGGGLTRGIADERWVYYRGRFVSTDMQRHGSMEVYITAAKYIQPFFQGLPITVAVPGASNMTAYYGDFRTCINEYGLTDSFVAHQPIEARARIGHEKRATEEYLMKRGANLELLPVMGPLPEQQSYVLMAIWVPNLGLWQVFRMMTYDKALMNQLAARFEAAGAKVVLPRYEYIIPDFVQRLMPTLPLAAVEANYEGFRKLYFDRYPDTAMEHRFEARIAELKRDSVAHAS